MEKQRRIEKRRTDRIVLGVVSSFEEDRGVGAVKDRDGASYFFHCVEIADGSRSIEVGAQVAFLLGNGPEYALEAVGVTRIDR